MLRTATGLMTLVSTTGYWMLICPTRISSLPDILIFLQCPTVTGATGSAAHYYQPGIYRRPIYGGRYTRMHSLAGATPSRGQLLLNAKPLHWGTGLVITAGQHSFKALCVMS